jgi:hypothetical protein
VAQFRNSTFYLTPGELATFPLLTFLSQSELVAQFRNSTFYLTSGELLPHFRYSPFYHNQSWGLSSATQPSTSRQVSYCHISATHFSITVQSELVAQFRNSPFYLTPGELLPHFRYSPFYHSQSWWRSSATQPSTSHQVSYCHISATHLSITIRAGGSVPQLNLLPHTR